MVPDRFGSTISSTSTGREIDDDNGPAETEHNQTNASLGSSKGGQSQVMSGNAGLANQPDQFDKTQFGEASTTSPPSDPSFLRVEHSNNDDSITAANTTQDDLQDSGMSDRRLPGMDTTLDRDSASTGELRSRPNANGPSPSDPLAPAINLLDLPSTVQPPPNNIDPQYTMLQPSADVSPRARAEKERRPSQPVIISGFNPRQTADVDNRSVMTERNQLPRRSSLTQSLRLHSLPVPPFPDSSRPNGYYDPCDPAIATPPIVEDSDHLYNNRSQVNSAPPSPAASTVLHPSAYIHTHHPRRGSLTPLNLNTISPMPPPALIQASVRRASHVATADGWTLPGSLGVRRKSLSPTMPTLAAASPTKIAASGSVSGRKPPATWSTTAGPGGRLVPSERRRSSLRPLTAGDGGIRASKPPSGLGARRASQPTVNELSQYGSRDTGIIGRGETGLGRTDDYPLTNAAGQALVPGSLGAGIRQDFKFGAPSASPIASGSRPRSRSRSSSNGSKSSPSNRTIASRLSDGDSIEAERQRIAFLNSNFARDPRGSGASIGNSNYMAMLGRSPVDTRGSTAKKAPSMLLGNEGFRRGSLGLPGYEAMSPPNPQESSPSKSPRFYMNTLAGTQQDGRRGSNPIDIPKKKKTNREADDAADHSESLDEMTSSNELAVTPPNTSGDVGSQAHVRKTSPLSRPLPPLLPLSDPGPRLLPSTLALHRANHLLQSKNLASEPMPHPLPASLHPPPPVDVSDFDIDFILAGAAAPTAPGVAPGGSTATDAQNSAANSTLKLGPGGDDEDTFAKFVGAFDEEYDDRRDEWTFKVCPPASRVDVNATTDGSIEWEAQRAGRYVISPTGDVTSKHTGRTWRVVRRVGREFDIENLPIVLEEGPEPPFGHTPSSHVAFVLAPKTIHNELGGVKMARKRPSAPTVRSSGSDEAGGAVNSNRQSTLAALSDRFGSDESARSTPMPNRGRNERAAAFLSSRRGSKSQEPVPATGLGQMTQNLLLGNHADGSKRDRKDRVSIGDKIKRTWKSGFSVGSPSFMDDRKERKEDKKQKQREKQQSHSWSGSSSQSSAWTSVGQSSSSSGKVSSLSREIGVSTEPRYQPPWMTSSGTVAGDRSRDYKAEGLATPPIVSHEETVAPMSFKEGKAWEAVPQDAMAMVIPICKPSIDTEDTEAHSCTPALRNGSFFDNASPESLLVYFVPFTSSHLSGDKPSKAARRASMGQRLRRARSKEQMPGGRLGVTDFATEVSAPQLVPLPFRSFRIVARVVEPDDLRSEPMLAPWPTTQDGQQNDPDTAEEEGRVADSSGTRFPTVIAVCHSRGQGVEFVLEGLDRLGLCEGQSAWGPTGYEEWRGSGLSRTGREILDVLWTACVAILGLTSKST